MATPTPPLSPPLPRVVLDPHPVITGSYDTPELKRPFLNAIFDATAQDYDRVERWLSLGTGRWYRRQALRRAGLQAGMHIADVAVGTGLVAGEALKLLGPHGRLLGIDPSVKMMEFAKRRLGIETVEGRAEAIPCEDASFDFVVMGYALRHVTDLHAAFSEFRRVLRPMGSFGAGHVCILEISRPDSRVGRAALRAYLGAFTRVLARVFPLAPRTPELWAYYWETINACLPPQRVLEALTHAGFVDVRRTVVAGVFSEYTARS